MKRFLITCAGALLFVVIVGVGSAVAQNSNKRGDSTLSNSTNSNSTSSPIPIIESVDHLKAPSGAVIQLTLKPGFEPGFLQQNFHLEIGRTAANFTVLEGSTFAKPLVAAVVPDIPALSVPPGDTRPVPIMFFTNEQNREGRVYEGFNLLIPARLNSRVEIVSVRKQSNSPYYDVRFDNEIPTDLWGSVQIVLDDKPVKIVQMFPKVFSFEIPNTLSSASSHDIYVKVGDNPSTTRELYSDFTLRPMLSSPATPTPVPSSTNISSLPELITFLSIILALAGILSALYFYRKSIRGKAALQLPVSADVEEEELHLPEEVPPPLVEACAAGECVLYAGAGLSAQSGLPTWKDFVLGLLDWAVENKFAAETEAVSLRAETRKGQADPVADSIVSRIKTERDRELLNAYLQKVFLKKLAPSSFHLQLKGIKFSSVLTTNFDNILETVYETQPGQVYTPKNTESLLAALTRRDFFILKLYGTLEKHETVMVAPAQYDDEIRGNSLFSRFMQTLFLSRTLLFIGASMDGIEAYLKGITFPTDLTRTHYALVGVTDTAWRAKADFLERRYGIKVLPYTPKEGYAELGDFLVKLTQTVTARPDTDTDAKRETSRLKRITLNNIGPFDNLELDFDLESEHKWHIFLGDNGVGKSTVLKAIAFALCGEKAQPYASRLLKRGRNEGKITLETDNKTSYVTAIKRESNGEIAIVGSDKQALPLEAEGWLAVGFPPLRTTSWEPPKGPDADFKIKSRPVVDDLLPLVKGDVDPRLDKLKQWIVNLDYQDIKNKSTEGHYKGLIQKVFNILGMVAEGMKLNYRGVGDGNKILIETDDGESIPLEALSQGTISLMGWIGILMQRLYEVFDQDKDPTQRYALILMDEIDAHMHPLWQRTLVTHLKETFPKAQFIATTHSPLVVGGMPARQVVRFARDKNGKAVVLPIAPDMTLGYTDQVLTSLLFGLPTTLDRTTEKKKERYYQLVEMKDRGDHQQEYEELKQELMARVPPPSGSYEEKHAKQKAEADMLMELGAKLSKRSPEEGQILLDRANNLLEMIGESQSNDKS